MSAILIIFTSVLIAFYLWLKYENNYWKRNNVPFIKSSCFFGNTRPAFFNKKCPAELFQTLYNNEETQNEPIVGFHIFNKPALLIREPKLIKKILVKDFNKFHNRYSKANLKTDKLASHNLFFLRYPQWKQMRNKLTPVFTSAKMKQMFHLVERIGNQFDEYLCSLTNGNISTVVKELKDTSALFTTEVIASVAFGIQANSMKNPKGQFRHIGKVLFRFTLWRALECYTIFFYPKFISLVGAKVFHKEASEFLRSIINYAMEEREKSGICRNDLIDILLKLRKESQQSTNETDYKLEGDALIAHAAVFFAAGFETTSSTIAFAVYELAQHIDIQERLRNDIKQCLIKNNGKLTYESLNEMTYLHMIIMEVLRLYPPLPFLDRECSVSKDGPGYSLGHYSDYKIPQGMPIYIPFYSIQRDPKYFPDPDTFNPERFARANKNDIDKYTFMPFGLGPHNCIGERLGIMQVKIGLISVLKNHKILPNLNSYPPMRLEERSFLLEAEGGIFCNIKRSPLLLN